MEFWEMQTLQEEMTLEEYKQKVRECLMKTHNYTGLEAEKLMTDYENDFQEALSKFSWTPATMAGAMIAGY